MIGFRGTDKISLCHMMPGLDRLDRGSLVIEEMVKLGYGDWIGSGMTGLPPGSCDFRMDRKR